MLKIFNTPKGALTSLATVAVLAFVLLAAPAFFISAAQKASAATTATLARTLSTGDSGSDVLALQRFLIDEGFLTVTANGKYGPATTKAVAVFQKAHKLEQTGAVSPKTLALLQKLTGGTAVAPASSPTTPTVPSSAPANPDGLVTQAQLQQAVSATVQQTLNTVNTALYGATSTMAGGGLWGAIAASQKIDNLSNVTINGAQVTGGISGLTASDIPMLPYLSLSGGTLMGSTTIPGLILPNVAGSAQCLHADANGNVTGTGADCSSLVGNISSSTVTATGSTAARALADRAADAVNVRDFGAKCDGTTNDTAAFQAAANLGVVVHVPAGHCMLQSLALQTGTWIVGEGRPGQYNWQSPSGTVLDFNNGAVGADGITSNGTVQSGGLANLQVERAHGNGINVTAVYFEVDNINSAYNGLNGLSLANSWMVTLRNSLFEMNGANGFSDYSPLAHAYTTLSLQNVYALKNTSAGIVIQNITAVSAVASAADANGSAGWEIIGSIGTISAGDAEANGTSGYHYSNSSFTCIACIASGNNTSAISYQTNHSLIENGSNVQMMTPVDYAILPATPSVNVLDTSNLTYSFGKFMGQVANSGTGKVVNEQNLLVNPAFVGNASAAGNVTAGAGSANALAMVGAASGAAPSVVASGLDTDISVGLTPKGAGRVNVNGTALLPSGQKISFNGSANLAGQYALYGDIGNTIINVPASGTIMFRINNATAARIDAAGHLWGSDNETPTIATNACGSATQGTVSGTDQSMLVTVGTVGVTSCTVTFGAAWAARSPHCSMTPANTAAAAQGTTGAYLPSPSGTTFVITGAALAGAAYQVHCQ